MSFNVSTRPLHANASGKANQRRSTFMRHKLPLSDSPLEHTRLTCDTTSACTAIFRPICRFRTFRRLDFLPQPGYHNSSCLGTPPSADNSRDEAIFLSWSNCPNNQKSPPHRLTRISAGRYAEPAQHRAWRLSGAIPIPVPVRILGLGRARLGLVLGCRPG